MHFVRSSVYLFIYEGKGNWMWHIIIVIYHHY